MAASKDAAESRYFLNEKSSFEAIEQVEVGNNSKACSKRAKTCRLRRIIAVLSGILIVFVILTIVFISLFSVAYQKNASLTNYLTDFAGLSAENSTDNGHGLCQNLACIISLGGVSEFLNRSANPCDNFYQYACGKFIDRFRLGLGETSRSSWDINSQAVARTLDNIFTSFRNESDLNSVTEKKAIKYYTSCLDVDSINKHGKMKAAELLRNIGSGDWYLGGAEYGGLLTGGVFPADRWRLEDSMVQMMVRSSITMGVIGLVIHQDQRNNSRTIITIDAPNLTLNGRQPYISNNETDSAVMVAYFDYIYKLANSFKRNKRYQLNNESIWEIINFERTIAEISPPASAYEHVTEHYRILSIEELQNECPIVNWSSLFRRVLLSFEVSPRDAEISEVAVFADYLPKLADFLTSFLAENPRAAVTIQNYMAFAALHAHADDLGSAISDLHSDFETALYGGGSVAITSSSSGASLPEQYDYNNEYMLASAQDDLLDRLDLCRAKTKRAFGLPLSKYFIDQHFTAEAKQIAVELVNDIRVGFLQELDDPAVDWMDDETKKAATLKANKMVFNVGYPDILSNETKLEELFDDMIVTDNFVKNVFNHYRFVLKNTFAELQETPDRSKWEMDPIESNAYYTTSANKIVIPAALLQVPFFNPSWAEAINYGAIGSVIGHEITHAFDVAGSQFDASGKIADWWDESTRQHFTERTKCISNQYSDYTVLDGEYHVDGEMTLSENIADNGGLTAAYRAFRTKVGSRVNEPPLPGFDLTNNQLFFLSFAQVWCQNIRPEQLITDIETDTHSPSEFRVIGAVSNSADFSEAFSCPIGSKMNPKTKCKVW